MKKMDNKQQKSYEKWLLPIDINFYDHDPLFKNKEYVQLEDLQYQWELGKHPAFVKYNNIQRLITPLQDVMTLITTLPEMCRTILRFMLNEMHKSKSTYWHWTEEQWLDVIQRSPSYFGSRSKSSDVRTAIIAFAYFLGNVIDIESMNNRFKFLIYKIFRKENVEPEVEKIRRKLLEMGYSEGHLDLISRALYVLMLYKRDPRIESLTVELLDNVRRKTAKYLRGSFVAVSYALQALGIISTALKPLKNWSEESFPRICEGISAEWLDWCKKWRQTSTVAFNTKNSICGNVRFFCHWLFKHHPDINSPDQVTRDIAIEFVGALDKIKIGEVRINRFVRRDKIGRPLSPRFKTSILGSLRLFFHNCQEWGWIPIHLNAQRCFGTPRTLRGLVYPNPRIIQDDIWAKLLWAGLNLTSDDLPRINEFAKKPTYPIEMMKALTIVWLFSGLRSDEIARLRVGCIRWQNEGTIKLESDELQKSICLLDIPVHKTGKQFTKPVDKIVGESIQAWEKARPQQVERLDPKTGEQVHFLFSMKGRRITSMYINNGIIPMLCRKAGVPLSDVRGNITSHRARATIASQLFNAKEPMSLFELQAWLGHSSPESTQHYTRISPTKLAQSFAKAGYFERNIRAVEVLIDQDTIKSGLASNGTPFIYYDLGHGYCTYDFFEQCPHRMTCPKCSFYVPKESTKAQLIEAKTNLLRMRQEIPLSSEEVAAVEDGLTAIEKLCGKLMNIPAPDGLTPRQLVKLKRKK